MCHDLFLGLNDSEGRDTEHIANIIETLKAGRFINTFLIVRNGNEQRMTKAYTDMLRIFELGFGVRRIQCYNVMYILSFPGQLLEPRRLCCLVCDSSEHKAAEPALDRGDQRKVPERSQSPAEDSFPRRSKSG